MSRTFAFVVVVAASACQAERDTCAESNERIRDGHAKISDEHGACDSDNDCEVISADVECGGDGPSIGNCDIIVSTAEREQAQEALDSLEDEVCATADPACGFDVDCAAVEPVCRDGACTSG